jgi:hypothetical protein
MVEDLARVAEPKARKSRLLGRARRVISTRGWIGDISTSLFAVVGYGKYYLSHGRAWRSEE